MLRIKFFESFKNNNPFLVIIADREGLRKAHGYFAMSNGAYLNDPIITEFYDIAPLTEDNLFVSEQECKIIAQHFKNLYAIDLPRHAYFDTVALGDRAEIIISFGEYDGLF